MVKVDLYPAAGGRDLDDDLLGRVLAAGFDVRILLSADGSVIETPPSSTPRAAFEPLPGGTTWLDGWPQERAAAAAALEAAQRGEIGRFEGRRRGADGSESWWAFSLLACADRGAGASCLLALGRDVTALRRSEARRLEAEEMADALLVSHQAAIWRASPDGSVVRTRGWERLTAQSDVASLGEGWLEVLHPDDLARARDQWDRALATGTLEPLEYRVRQTDGSYRWMLVRARPKRGADGQIAEWIGIVTDIEATKQSETALHRSDETARLAIEATGIGVWRLELPSRRTEWSAELKALGGMPADIEMTDEIFYGQVHPDDRFHVEEMLTLAIASGSSRPYRTDYRFTRLDTGEERWFHEWGRMVCDPDGQPTRFVGAILDITEKKKAEIERQASESRLQLALHAGRMVAWERDARTGMIVRSDNADDMMGNVSEHVSEFLKRVHPDDVHGLATYSGRSLPEGRPARQFRYNHPDGRQLWFESSAIVIRQNGVDQRVVGVDCDITDKKAAEAQLRYAASHDPLTGLHNRAWFQAEFARVIRKVRHREREAFLLMLDVDQFKDVNDTLGHDAGDKLLRVTGERLRRAVGDKGCVARLGGDEFAALLYGGIDLAGVQILCQELQDTLDQPFKYRGLTLTIRTSIGIAACPLHDTTATELFKDADLALYAAKTAGRRQTKVYDPAMRHSVESRLALIQQLEAAIAAGQIVPFYQPKVDLGDGRVVGFEALARWQHPQRGLLAPNIFGDAFADPVLAVVIDDLMVRQVVADLRLWLDAGLKVGRVSVNVSAFSFKLPDLVERILGHLAGAHVPTGAFEIEVTETVFLDGTSADVAGKLRELNLAGVKISLDDFGTGYASLTHLKRFPVDEIKIDQSFVRDLETDMGNAAIVSAVIGMGSSLGLTLVAEGVETDYQVDRLRAWGCHYAQGYRYSKPIAASRIPWFLAQNALDVHAKRAAKRSA